MSRKTCRIAKRIIFGVTVSILLLGIIAMILLVPRSAGRYPDDTWYGAESFNIDNIQKVAKEKGKDFSILVITDTQFDDPFQSKAQVKADLAKMVEVTAPDLIVTVGDNFAGIFNHFHVSAFVAMMDELGVPWAPIFGNHERDFGADLIYLAKEMQKSELCLLEIGPTNIDGVGNYVLNIEEENNPICSLVLMDCNEEVFLKDVSGKRVGAYYDSPHHNQVEWYKDNIRGIEKNAGKKVPSVIFTHTPIPQFKTANDLYEAGSDEVTYLGGEGKVSGAGVIDYGLFDAALSLGSTKHMFFGHDHENTLMLEYKGIQLAYAVKTGNFSSYEEGKTGGVHLTVGEGGAITTKQLNVANL